MKFFETLLSGLKAIILSHSYSKIDSDAKYLTKDKQAQPDWKITNSKDPSFIKNKPTLIGKEGSVEGAEIFNDYDYNRASGICSHAEGCQTTASGGYSHAEGYYTTASGEGAHAEGAGNSITVGNTTIIKKVEAIGKASHAEGLATHALSRSQHVQGEHNIADTEGTANTRGKYVHIVGNGYGEIVNGLFVEHPSNAHTLDWDGNAWFAGDVYIGGTSQDDAKKLLTSDEYSIPIKDSVTGVRYVIMMKNGQIISRSATKSIEVITMPTSSTIEGGYLDMTGMVVNATLESGEVITIDNSLLDKVVVTDSIVKITYYEAGYRFIDETEINMIPIEEALIDFTYTIQDDGTYYLTGWKGTLNGVTSDTLVVPNSTLIVL